MSIVTTYIDVVFDVRKAGMGGLYTYFTTSEVKLGSAVLAPLGTRSLLGYVCGCSTTPPNPEVTYLEAQPIKGLSLPEALMTVVQKVSRETLCSLPAALSAAMAPGIHERIVTTWERTPAPNSHELSTLQEELLKQIEAEPLIERKAKPLSAPLRKALRLLAEKELVQKRVAIEPPRTSRPMLYRLISDSEKVERFLDSERKRKPAQALTVIRMQHAGPTPLSPADIKALSGVTDQTLKALVNAGILEPVESLAQPRHQPTHEPNPYQATAIKAITKAVQTRKPETFLLFGVTGSGKTEVYLQSAAECLAHGRKVLMIVPEIALASQALSKLRDRFGDRVALVHSGLAAGERLDTWLRIQKGSAAIVLGARSALFAPLDDIGLIIVDEEHEPAYKQDSVPRYHARTVAQWLAEAHGATVVLGSATPSLETYHLAQNGTYKLLTLPERAANATLPTIHLVSLAELYQAGEPSLLSPFLKEQIEETLKRKEQVILFLNRRAYAPSLVCRECGQGFPCPRCSVNLSFSRKLGKLRCHHCDYSMNVPTVCPKCGGVRLKPLGIGTEKVEETLHELFPQARIARLDRDIASRKGALDEILTNFRMRDIDILVGTQMIAKGLDFPYVTLVGVIAADMSLNMPDFRAGERTYQLLSQVAGRAGRGNLPGQVIIQTFNPEQPVLQATVAHDYEGIAQSLLSEREAVSYPPYVQLVNILVSGDDLDRVIDASADITLSLKNHEELTILGPAIPAIERLQNKWRRHVLIKAPLDFPMPKIDETMKDVNTKEVQIVVDVDPSSLI